MADKISGVLRAVANVLNVPVMIVLIVLMAASIFFAGTLLVEIFTRNKTFDNRRKKALAAVKSAGADKCESLAMRLVKAERTKYEGIVKLTDGIAKLGPMFGLLGTLIPLGPGIIALGRGDTFTLSQSMLTAFDTTIAGLIAAAIAFVVSGVRKRWYAKHLTILEENMEDLLDEIERE